MTELNDVTDAGSGQIITDDERSKLDEITDTGSGQIITDAERDKLNEIEPDTIMSYRGFYDPAIDPPVQYKKNDVVVDGEFLSIAKDDTTDRPSPLQIGTARFLLDSDTTDFQANAKQYVKGNRYTAANNLVLKGFKIKTVIGNRYSVFLVIDPENTAITQQLFVFTSNETGFTEIQIQQIYFEAGAKYDLFTIISEPDPVIVSTDLDYNYSRPNNTTVPISGQITHSNKALNELYVSVVDSNTIDNTVFLQSLQIGDRIEADGIIWSIQSIQDQGTYMIFTIAPTLQLSSDGLKTFTFENVADSIITFDYNPNYWGTELITAQGFEGESMDSVVFNNNAYGIDGLINDIQFSDNWDILSTFSQTGVDSSPVAPEDGYVYGLKDGVFVRVDDKAINCTIFSVDSIVANGDGTPVVITGWQIFDSYLLDITNDKIQNISDRPVLLTGSISITPDKSGGGTSELAIVTDISSDGVSWVENPSSLVLLEISGNNESMQSKFSGITLQPGEFGRVRMAVTNGNTVTIYEPNRTINSETYSGYSCIWELSEK